MLNSKSQTNKRVLAANSLAILTLSLLLWFFVVPDVEAKIMTPDRWHWTSFNTANSDLPENTVNSLAVATDGALWIGTNRGGLACFSIAEKVPRIVELIGRLDSGENPLKISQQQYTFAVLPFDPNYQTALSQFRYHWTLKRDVMDKPLDDRIVRSSVYTSEFPEDGRYTVRVVVSDIHGQVNVVDPKMLCKRCGRDGRHSDQNPTVPGRYDWCAGCNGSGYAS
jgi:hypothetical protein